MELKTTEAEAREALEVATNNYAMSEDESGVHSTCTMLLAHDALEAHRMRQDFRVWLNECPRIDDPDSGEVCITLPVAYLERILGEDIRKTCRACRGTGHGTTGGVCMNCDGKG